MGCALGLSESVFRVAKLRSTCVPPAIDIQPTHHQPLPRPCRLPSNFQLLAAVPRLVPEAVPRMAELEDGQRAGEGFAAELELGAHFGEAYNERDPSPDIGVLLSVLCKVRQGAAVVGEANY